MEGVTFEEVLKLNNPIIVDIRDNYSYCLGHIPNSINIPYYNLLSNFSHYLNKNNIYYLYDQDRAGELLDTGYVKIEKIKEGKWSIVL